MQAFWKPRASYTKLRRTRTPAATHRIMTKQREKLFSEFPPVSTEEWMDAITKDLKGADFNKKLVWNTSEGFSVNPFYRAEDLENIGFPDTEPGQFPYVRGNRISDNDWKIRQDFRIPDIVRCNALAAEAAAKGADEIGVCCREVMNPDHMEMLLRGIDLNRTGIHFLCSRSYGKTLELFMEYLDRHGLNPEKMHGSIEFDPIGYALLHGAFYGSFQENMDEAADLFKRFASILPGFRLIHVGASLLHNAGGSNVQELAFAMNWACEYFSSLTERGIGIDTLCQRTVLHLGIGSDYFMEIAKLRTARLLWAHMAEGFKPEHEKSLVPFIHAESSTWNQSIYDPYVNMLRSTTETMSAAIGGADSIHVNDFSHAFRESDAFSARIARNQQILLKEESFFNRIIDPAAGSYYIENLTSKLAESAWKLFLETEETGGIITCIENGHVQEKIAECAAKRNEELAKRKRILTGVNQFPNLNEKEAEHLERPLTTPAPEGKFKVVRPYRGAEPFEALRLQTEEYARKNNGERPKVFLLTYGNLAMRKARAGFATNFFGCLGYEIIDNPGFENGIQGAEAALKSGAQVTVLCSSDEEYAELAAQSCPLLKGKTTLVYAGFVAEEKPFRDLGIECFIHVRSNVLETLARFQEKLLN